MLGKQSGLLLLAIVLSVAPVAAQNRTPTVTDQNGCKIYNPMPQEEESVRWSGACRGGFADGKGVLEWFIGGRLEERYDGEMSQGWAEGKGIFVSRQGMRYEGEWKRSQQHGQGVARSPDGSVYEGEWQAGKPHGWGTYTSPNGETVTGEWENGELKSESSSRRI